MIINTKSSVSRGVLSVILVVAFLLLLCPVAHADSYGTLAVYSESNRFSLGVMSTNQEWYVNADDLARIGGFSVSVNNARRTITIYKESPFVILYTADNKTYIENSHIYFVPLQEASVSVGIRFFEMNNEIHFEVLRTPKELVAELSKNVFGNQMFRLSDLFLDMGETWIVMETSARGYAILSSFSLSAYVKALSGEADQARYNQAMASIIANDAADVSSFAALADINKYFTKTDKVLDTFDWLFEKSSKFYYWFTGANWTQAEFQAMRDQMELYGELGGVREFLDAYSYVSNTLDLKYLFNVILYIESVNEAEENIVNAMQKVFSESDNEHARSAASKVVSNRYGVGLAAIDVAGNAAIEASSKKIDALFNDLVFGDLNWKAKVDKFIATQIFEYGFKLPNKSEAIIYLPIYSAIQQDLSRYFYNNSYDYSNENLANLRSVGIMYLKAAIAAYKNFDFDPGLDDSVSLATAALRNEINELLSYGECEYSPDYTNQVIIDGLNKNGISTNSDIPQQDDLFNETFWSFRFGQTLGSAFDALFHKDGTFTARNYGSGRYDDGTYTYQNGVLTINFWFTGSGCSFEGDASGFVSSQKHEMQVGEDYYTITPIHGESSFYFEPSPTPMPTPIPTPAPTPKPTQAPSITTDTLADGEYYGLLTSWSKETMTIEIYNFEGRHEMSFNYILTPTGKVLTLNISQATVWLENAWNNGVELQCDSIDSALNTKVWDGSTALRDACTMSINFIVSNSQVKKIVFLYTA